jgi:hypothetical protein
MRCTSQEAASLLRRIEEGFDRERRSIDDDGGFLAGLEREARQRRDRVLEELPRTLAGARGRYENEVGRLAQRMRSLLGFWPTLRGLFFGGSAAVRMEAALAEGLEGSLREFARIDAERLLAECAEHWRELRPRVRERMGFDPGAAEIQEGRREEVIEGFVEHVVRAVSVIMGRLRLRASLDQPLRARSRQLRFFLGVGLVVLTAAGTCGTLRLDGWAWALLASAVSLGAGFVVAVWMSRGRVIAGTRTRLRDAVGTFERGLREDYAEAVHYVFEQHSDGLHELRRQLAQRLARLRPQQEAWDQLHLELRSIEQSGAF